MRPDPLSHAQATLEAYIAASPAVVAVMKSAAAAAKNIDGFTKTRSTKQNDVLSESDLPQIKLIPIGGPTNVNFASNATAWDFTVQVGVNSGDMRFTEKLAPLVFAVYATVAKAIDDSVVVGLTLEKCLPQSASSTLKAYEFVKNATLSNITTGMVDTLDPRNRGISGFSGLLDLTLHMIFPRSFVKDWAAGEFN